MKHYRVYCFDGGSRIINAEWIEAGSDDIALQSARATFDCFKIEVWDRDRLVGRHERSEADQRIIRNRHRST